MKKLPKLSNEYIINFGSDYYRKLTISEHFKLFPTTEDALFKLLKNIEVTKAAGRSNFKMLEEGGVKAYQ